MKKIFTTLLALVGMVAGFTLTSCGGGGGGGDEIGPNLEGLDVQLSGGTPYFHMYIGERRGRTNNYACTYQLGDSNTTGSLSILPGYPRPADNGEVVELKAQMGFDSTSWLQSSEDAAQMFDLPTVLGKGCVIFDMHVTLKLTENGGGSIVFEGKGHGYTISNTPNVPSESDWEDLGVDGPYYPVNKTFYNGLSVTGPLKRLFGE